MFDVVYCVLLFLVSVGIVCCVLLLVGCCMLSVVVLCGLLFAFGMCFVRWLMFLFVVGVVGCLLLVSLRVRLLFCVAVGDDGCCCCLCLVDCMLFVCDV